MTTADRQARISALWFVVVILTAPLRLVVVPDRSAQDVLENLPLFRMAMLADLVCGAAMIFLTLALRKLFPNERALGNTMVILGGIIPAALYVVNVGNDSAALLLAQGSPGLAGLSEAARLSLCGLFLHLHDRMVVAAELYWGLWLLPLGIMVWRSAFLPRVLAAWLIANGIAYIAQCAAGFAWPAIAPTLSSICAPIQFGEIVFALWLLIMGARRGFHRKGLAT